jgi:hypothetical protein
MQTARVHVNITEQCLPHKQTVSQTYREECEVNSKCPQTSRDYRLHSRRKTVTTLHSGTTHQPWEPPPHLDHC